MTLVIRTHDAMRACIDEVAKLSYVAECVKKMQEARYCGEAYVIGRFLRDGRRVRFSPLDIIVDVDRESSLRTAAEVMQTTLSFVEGYKKTLSERYLGFMHGERTLVGYGSLEFEARSTWRLSYSPAHQEQIKPALEALYGMADPLARVGISVSSETKPTANHIVKAKRLREAGLGKLT